MTDNLYNFADTSDLPADLSKRLSGSAAANPNIETFVGIIRAAYEAGLKIMSISQIEAVAHRMGLDSKAQQTIRTALNAGVRSGELFKPSRQTYAIVPVGPETAVSDAQPVDVLDVGSNSAAAPVASPADAQIDPLA